jgi:23S rRNA pseudouridine1911/1915/1917 synthase
VPNEADILFEDPNVLVLNKPAGLLSQGDHTGEPNLVDVLRTRFGRHYVGLIHRLDRNTTGIMVVAKRSKAAERLTAQLQKGDLIRKYRAILWGSLPIGAPQNWEHWLLKNEQTNETRVVPPHTPHSKIAKLKAHPLKTLIHPQSKDPLTLVEFELETGRGHQIRAQSNAVGHPLIGDPKYHNAKSLTLFGRPALHSSFLAFDHPISKERKTFELRYSADMIRFFSTELE